jgi:hypothetical protein
MYCAITMSMYGGPCLGIIIGIYVKVTTFFLAFSGIFAQKTPMEAKEGSFHLNYTSYTL